MRFRLIAVDAGRSLTMPDCLDPRQQGHDTLVAERSDASMRIVRAGWLFALIAVGLQSGAELTNAFALADAHAGLDAAIDGNAFDWISSALAMAGAISLLVLAAAGTERRRSTIVLALLIAFLAVDDLINLHDQAATAFAGALPEPFDRLGAWSMPILYMPLLAATFALIWSHGTRARPELAHQVQAALTLLTAAVVLRLLVGLLEIRGFHASERIRVIGIATLEGAEVGAWSLIAAAFVAQLAEVVSGGRAA